MHTSGFQKDSELYALLQIDVFFENMKREMVVKESDCEILSSGCVFTPVKAELDKMKIILEKAQPNFPTELSFIIAEFSCTAGTSIKYPIFEFGLHAFMG